MSSVEGFIQGFEANRAAQLAAGEWGDQMANLGAGAITLKAVINVGGQAVNMIYDRVKKAWIKEDFDKLVETYELSSSASIKDTLTSTPDKSIIEDEQKKWGS